MRYILIILVVVGLIFSCGERFNDLNIDRKNPTSVSGESLFTSAQKNMMDQMTTPNVNSSIFRLLPQYWAKTTYPDESQYNVTTRRIPEQHWRVIYRDVLENLKQAAQIIKARKLLTGESEAVKNNKLQVIEIMSVYAYAVLVETFGDVPYTEALDINKVLPKYDDAATIYADLITRLTAAIDALAKSPHSFGVADNMYQGKVDKWVKFGNSLKLRMGLLVADVKGFDAKKIVEDAAKHAGGLIAKQSENASITYLSTTPNTNPVYENVVLSERDDFVPANTLVNRMNTLSDPRRAAYFTEYPAKSKSYKGGVYGKANAYANFSHINPNITKATYAGTILDYAEVEFLLAEAAARGYSVKETAAKHYQNAIRASFEFWGVASDTTSYLSKPEVAYATAIGTWKQKIGIQKWIALYSRGFAGWTSFRKLGFPKLKGSDESKTAGDVVPSRYTYPTGEQTLNSANYQTAAAAIGGDKLETKLFWQK